MKALSPQTKVRQGATALFIVAAVELTCPYCQAAIEAKNGSFFWTVTELGVQREKGFDLECSECGKSVKIPSRIPGL